MSEASVVLGFDPKFTICPNGLIDSDLSHAAVRIWLLLRTHADQTARCYPGQEYISRRLKMSERHVRNCLNELRDKKWLKWAARNNRRTEGLRTNIYTLMLPLSEDGTGTTGPAGQRNYSSGGHRN